MARPATTRRIEAGVVGPGSRPRISEDWLAIDVARNADAEIAQDRRRDVDDPRRGGADRAAADQHARGDRVIVAAMIGAPLAIVLVDDPGRRTAERRLPRHTIALVHADLELGGVGEVGAGIDVVALVDRAD